jgi:hypothetical protein
MQTALYFDVLLVIGGFFSLFLFFIFASRFHVSIGQSSKQSLDLKEKAQDLSVQLHLFDRFFRSKLDVDADAAKVIYYRSHFAGEGGLRFISH